MFYISWLVLLVLVAPTYEQETPTSPCPNVFMYEPPGTEEGRWYGVVNLSTDTTLHSVWLNIVLDSKADILGNWVGDVSTQDNIDFKVENTKMKIEPGPAVAVRFFVQYNTLNKTPRLQIIRLNGREICNANNPQLSSDGPTVRPTRPQDNVRPQDSVRPQSPIRPQDSVRPVVTVRPQTAIRPQDPDRTQDFPLRPEDTPHTRPINANHKNPNTEGPVYKPPLNLPNPSSIGGGGVSSQTLDDGRPTYLTTERPHRQPGTRPEAPDFVDNDNVSKGQSPDYYTGGPLLVLPTSPQGTSNPLNLYGQSECGRVVINPVPLVVNGTPTSEGQWPWQIALYQTQTVDNKYICGGTLVTHRHVITAAHCVTRKGSKREVNANTLTVFLGKHNLRTSVTGVQIKFVERIIVHPQYNATGYSRDVAILELKDPVQYTEWVRPACLWPENEVDLHNIIGKKGSVVGWGFDASGVASEELNLAEMPVVDQLTCVKSYSEFFVRYTSDYTFCAGYRDGTSVCNGDSGGGMVFNKHGVWSLRGLVSISVARPNELRCDPTHYVIFTDLAKFLPWIKQNVFDY